MVEFVVGVCVIIGIIIGDNRNSNNDDILTLAHVMFGAIFGAIIGCLVWWVGTLIWWFLTTFWLPILGIGVVATCVDL